MRANALIVTTAVGACLCGCFQAVCEDRFHGCLADAGGAADAGLRDAGVLAADAALDGGPDASVKCDQWSLSQRADYPVGNADLSLALGDLNGDGYLDVVVGGFGEVGVLLGEGDGTLAPKVATTAPALSGVVGVALADFGVDGIPDLAVVGSGRDVLDHLTTVVMPGTGDGAFGAAVRYSGAGPSPTSLAVGDLDGDGAADLVVTEGVGSLVAAWRGRGDGTFADATTIPVHEYPFALTLADFDGDGRTDAAVGYGAFSGGTGNGLAILHGNGDGTFALRGEVRLNPVPADLSARDLDGDGDLDLVVGYSDASGAVSVLGGRGDGTFLPPVDVLTAGVGSSSVALADLDGDGSADLAVGNQVSNSLSVLLGRGDGTFGPAALFPTGAYPVGLATGDINRDGRTDVVTVNQTGKSVTVLLTGCR